MGHAENIIARGEELATAVTVEMTLEDNRHAVKMAAISRIMQSGDNPLTGKPHSFSSAEANVSSDVSYALHLEALRTAAADRIRARAHYDAAWAHASLAAAGAL